MTKYEWPDVIPDFDVLKWKDEIQLQIYEETKDMTTEEWLAYVRRGSEEFRKERELRWAERAKQQEAK